MIFEIAHISLGNTELLLSDKALAELTELVRVINPNSKPVTRESMTRFFITNGYCAYSRTAGSESRIVGIATVILLYKLTGLSARLEHVAVLPRYQGTQGIGRTMVKLLIEECDRLHVARIDLTCEEKRIKANKLYESLGFVLRDTNTRRLTLTIQS